MNLLPHSGPVLSLSCGLQGYSVVLMIGHYCDGGGFFGPCKHIPYSVGEGDLTTITDKCSCSVVHIFRISEILKLSIDDIIVL